MFMAVANGMVASYSESSPMRVHPEDYPYPSRRQILAAGFIDLGITQILYLVTSVALNSSFGDAAFPWELLPYVVAGAYLLFGDFHRGASIGKRLFGLRLISCRHGGSPTFLELILHKNFIPGSNLMPASWQSAEEISEIEAGRYDGCILTSTRPETDAPADALSDQATVAPSKAIDLDGLADFLKKRDKGKVPHED